MSAGEAHGQAVEGGVDGILVAAKPGGMTSHDVVAWARRITGEKRVGHAGTLDPGATGVLVILVGRATAAMRFMVGLSKAYRAEVVLGVVTDTHDASGRVVRVAGEVRVSKETLLKVLRGYEGEISQVPPMVSAVHHQGRRLYELARKGIEVERSPRRVTVYGIRVESWPDWPLAVGSRITLSVECSSGTYIRQLAADVGESLGCGAHLGSLARTRVGPFTMSDAHTLDEIGEAARDGRLRDLLLPIARGLSHLPAVSVSGDDARRISSGASADVCVNGEGTAEAIASVVATDAGEERDAPPGSGRGTDGRAGLVRVHRDDGELLGIARADMLGGRRLRLRPIRMFVG